MKDRQENAGHWKGFIIFTLFVSIIVGFFSVISDNLPNLADGVTVLEFIISYLAVMINSLPVWFILVMLVGYIFASNIWKAVLLGTIYTITAISFYFVIGHIYEDRPVPISFKEQVVAYAIWYGASLLGGIIGGIVGFVMKRTPYALLILLVGLILQLFVNGQSSWRDIVGISQNATFCLLIFSIIIYLVIVRIKKDMKKNTESTMDL